MTERPSSDRIRTHHPTATRSTRAMAKKTRPQEQQRRVPGCASRRIRKKPRRDPQPQDEPICWQDEHTEDGGCASNIRDRIRDLRLEEPDDKENVPQQEAQRETGPQPQDEKGMRST